MRLIVTISLESGKIIKNIAYEEGDDTSESAIKKAKKEMDDDPSYYRVNLVYTYRDINRPHFGMKGLIPSMKGIKQQSTIKIREKTKC